jgi:ClpP class serine protease
MLHARIIEEIGRHVWAVTVPAMEAILRIVTDGSKMEEATIFHGAAEAMRGANGEITAATGEDGAGALNFSARFGEVGVMRVEGPIVPRDGMEAISQPRLTSVAALQADLDQMAADPRISRVLMIIDSPGGAVTGISELAAQIESFQKPIAAYVYGMGASAAYWIASAADEIASANTGLVGSVGCVMTLATGSDARTVEIVSSQSPKKRLDPATESGRAHYQDICDSMAQVFVEHVAAARAVSVDTVLEEFGEGGLVTASAALESGMIDRISTLSDFMAEFSSSAEKKRKKTACISQDASNRVDVAKPENRYQNEDMENPTEKGEPQMTTLNELLAQDSDVKKEFEERIAAARAEAVKAIQEEMDFAAKIAAGTEYPPTVRTIAAEVISGKRPRAALDGAMAAVEMTAEAKKSDEAMGASAELPTTPAQASERISEDHIVRSEADFRAAVKRARGER